MHFADGGHADFAHPTWKKRMDNTLILGIDPGSRCTGYGLITTQGTKFECVAFGEIRTDATQGNARLQKIDDELRKIIAQYQPHEAAIEQVFTFHNHQSALKLGQARGVALVAVATFSIPISEYSARQVKKAVVGYGAASKAQVQHMVTLLLKLKKSPAADAADALAIALCHASSRRLRDKLGVMA
jgi:crossover junction endodeoxyribonuclease RuvC